MTGQEPSAGKYSISVIGLLLGTRYLRLAGASSVVLQPARRLLLFAGMVTLALKRRGSAGGWRVRKAVFDAVGPLLLIGWAERGARLIAGD